MNDTTWLLYAGMAVWLILGGYLFLLGKKTASLENSLRRLQYQACPSHDQDTEK